MAGRPSDYEPRFSKIAYELMSEGASLEELAWHLRKATSSISEWQKNYPEFSEAIKTGRDFAKGWWLKEGRININNKEFNSTLWYMNMKNRYGWADKQEQNHTVTVKQEDALKDLE